MTLTAVFHLDSIQINSQNWPVQSSAPVKYELEEIYLLYLMTLIIQKNFAMAYHRLHFLGHNIQSLNVPKHFLFKTTAVLLVTFIGYAMMFTTINSKEYYNQVTVFVEK